MKLISDIRIYQSDVENTDGNPLPGPTGNRALNLAAQRIAMKLREAGFSLGEFTHLYLNFTTCLPEGTIRPAKRTADRYHPWYRYYDVGVCRQAFDRLNRTDASATEVTEMVFDRIRQALVTYFAPDGQSVRVIESAVEEALSKGAEMRMRFKEKKAAKATAVLYLTLREDARYEPVVCVYDLQGRTLLEETLAPTSDLSSIGEILLSSRKVTVKPRKSVYAQGLAPVSFSF